MKKIMCLLALALAVGLSAQSMAQPATCTSVCPPGTSGPIKVFLQQDSGTLALLRCADSNESITLDSTGWQGDVLLWIADCDGSTPTNSIGQITLSGDGSGITRVFVLSASRDQNPQFANFEDSPLIPGSVNFGGLSIPNADLRLKTRASVAVTGTIERRAGGTTPDIHVNRIIRLQAGTPQTGSDGIAGGNIDAIVLADGLFDGTSARTIGEVRAGNRIGSLVGTPPVASSIVASFGDIGNVRVLQDPVGGLTAEGIRGDIRADEGGIVGVFSTGQVGSPQSFTRISAQRMINQIRVEAKDASNALISLDAYARFESWIDATFAGFNSVEVSGNLIGPPGEIVLRSGKFISTPAGRSGLFVRGFVRGDIECTGIAFGTFVADHFDGDVRVFRALKGSLVAVGTPTTNNPRGGTFRSVFLGLVPDLQGGMAGSGCEPFVPGPGFDWYSGTSLGGQLPTGLTRCDGGAMTIAGSLDSVISGHSAESIFVKSMARSLVTFKEYVPRIEVRTIGSLTIENMCQGVVWSGRLDRSDDFASIGSFVVNESIGANAAVWIRDHSTIRIDGTLSGRLNLRSLSATQTVRIGNSLADGTVSSGVGRFAEADPRNAGQLDGIPPLYDLKSRINLHEPDGLRGQIILNASNTVVDDLNDDVLDYPAAWRGEVIVNAADPDPANRTVLSPTQSVESMRRAPFYSVPSAMLGGGAVGVVPFALYEADCDPLTRASTTGDVNAYAVDPDWFSAGGNNVKVPVRIRFYGPVEVIDSPSIEMAVLGNAPYPVCSATWMSDAEPLFLVREPGSSDVVSARTVGLSRSELQPGMYSQIPAGLFRVFDGLRVAPTAMTIDPSIIVPVRYLDPCDSPDRPGYYFRVQEIVGTLACRDCLADTNCSAAVGVQDLFDFLAAYFGNCPGYADFSNGAPCFRGADFNLSGQVGVQDIFDFLAAWFMGC